MKALLLSACILASSLVHVNAADKELPLPIDQKYVVRAVECAIAEVKFADTAVEKTKNPEIKKLAETIKNDHNACLEKFMAQAKTLKLGVVEGLSKDHQEAAANLAKLEGDEFDKEYVRGVIDRHEKLILSSDKQIKDGQVEGISTMSKEALVVMKTHLESARKVQANLKK